MLPPELSRQKALRFCWLASWLLLWLSLLSKCFNCRYFAQIYSENDDTVIEQPISLPSAFTDRSDDNYTETEIRTGAKCFVIVPFVMLSLHKTNSIDTFVWFEMLTNSELLPFTPFGYWIFIDCLNQKLWIRVRSGSLCLQSIIKTNTSSAFKPLESQWTPRTVASVNKREKNKTNIS